MPKLKTKSGAKKRFKITGTGKVDVRPGRQAPRDDQADDKQIRNLRGTTDHVRVRWRVNVKKYFLPNGAEPYARSSNLGD